MAENIFLSAGKKYDARKSRVASENSLFPTQKIDLYPSIYGKPNVVLLEMHESMTFVIHCEIWQYF